MFWQKKITPEEAEALRLEAEAMKQDISLVEPAPVQPAPIEPQPAPQPPATEPVKLEAKPEIKLNWGLPGAGAKHLITKSIIKRQLKEIKITNLAYKQLEKDLIAKIEQAKQRAIGNKRKTILIKDL